MGLYVFSPQHSVRSLAENVPAAQPLHPKFPSSDLDWRISHAAHRLGSSGEGAYPKQYSVLGFRVFTHNEWSVVEVILEVHTGHALTLRAVLQWHRELHTADTRKSGA